MTLAHDLDANSVLQAIADIRSYVGKAFVKPSHVPNNRIAFERLAYAIGFNDAETQGLSDSALHSLYVVACSKGGPEAARRMAEQRFAKPAPAPAPSPAPAPVGPVVDMDALRRDLSREMRQQVQDAIDAAVSMAIETAAREAAQAGRRVVVTNPKAPTPIVIDNAHLIFNDVLDVLALGLNAYISGPAGSGKTSLADQLCKALGLPFYSTSSVGDPSELLGFISPLDHTYHRTAFREAFEHGGGFLFDEIDNSDPQAVTVFNMALANREMTFPDRHVVAHPDFRCIAAANTDGKGGTGQYVRNVLDAATLDRFVRFHMPYDETLELQIAPCEQWTKHVQRVRAIVEAEGIKAIISPRASIMGGKLISERGWSIDKAADHTLFYGMAETEVNRIKARL